MEELDYIPVNYVVEKDFKDKEEYIFYVNYKGVYCKFYVKKIMEIEDNFRYELRFYFEGLENLIHEDLIDTLDVYTCHATKCDNLYDINGEIVFFFCDLADMADFSKFL